MGMDLFTIIVAVTLTLTLVFTPLTILITEVSEVGTMEDIAETGEDLGKDMMVVEIIITIMEITMADTVTMEVTIGVIAMDIMTGGEVMVLDTAIGKVAAEAFGGRYM